MIVSITAEAEADIEAIGDFIAQDDPVRAITFTSELRGKCLGLADFPQKYPLVPRYATHGIRKRLYGSYLIFYHVSEDLVTVLHVVHGAQDYAAILG